MPAPIRTRDGVALFHRDWGEGPPVVFVASWSLPSDSWCYQMLALAGAGFRCVAYDRRGHGRSDDPGRGYDFDTLADDLAAVLEQLDLRGATLVGFSMGCGEVLRCLTRHGAAGRVARAVLIGTTTPMLTRAPDNPAGLRNWVRDMALRSSLRALLECHRTLAAADFRAEARAIDVPVLLLHGERDMTSPPDLTARPTAALLPKARLEIYEGAPHGLFLTHQARLNADLIAFARG
ncbi:alpha/beta hydrolase [Roseomonas sp. E05]|uniref:alpha/beta fold hydrolase n=1 Tax=Roseomonas sp. E05 TaxID=3046310 RepID=UPI0024BB7BD7|nr:alpha/beta hydrolase [Roseomonas sp. E05]MDJ0387831.1 alpha/beta hydrolase [Roseomonas sp. E05]